MWKSLEYLISKAIKWNSTLHGSQETNKEFKAELTSRWVLVSHKAKMKQHACISMHACHLNTL